MEKTFKPNKNGKIEFTKEQLKNLLDEVWRDGYNVGYARNYTWRSPWYYDPWYPITWTTTTGSATGTATAKTVPTDSITINANNPYTVTTVKPDDYITYTTDNITLTTNNTLADCVGTVKIDKTEPNPNTVTCHIGEDK